MDLNCSLSKLHEWAIGVPLTRYRLSFADLGPKTAGIGYRVSGERNPDCPFVQFRRASTIPTAYLRSCRNHKAGF
jgi:hypothetical protein